MERVILWSKENSEYAGELSRALSIECNVVTEVLTEDEALIRVAALGDRESSIDSKALFIDADTNIPVADAIQITRLASSFGGAFGSFAFKNGSEMASFPEIDASNIINAISPVQSWSCAAIVVSYENCKELGEATSMPEAILRMAIHAIGDDSEIDWTIGIIDTAQSASEYEYTLSNEICSAILQFTLSAVNVEDLFPTHSWHAYEQESAAACYHTLAAKFISLEDHARAKECLAEGDQLEDSPRSLALKGLIALREGEVLTAVANMVSSLQEYEKRKEPSTDRYLTFSPSNLEGINSSLQNGLAALNKKENDSAAGHFTEAVFEFDNFYIDCGLRQPKVQ